MKDRKVTKVIIIAYPECPDASFEPPKSQWDALLAAMKPYERKVLGERMVLATSERNIQNFANKMSVHLRVDRVTIAECLMSKDDFECVGDYLDVGIALLIAIATREVAEALSSHLTIQFGMRPTKTGGLNMGSLEMYAL